MDWRRGLISLTHKLVCEYTLLQIKKNCIDVTATNTSNKKTI